MSKVSAAIQRFPANREGIVVLVEWLMWRCAGTPSRRREGDSYEKVESEENKGM